jgi:hypothetical protein
MLTSKQVLVLAQNLACVYSRACFLVRSPQPEEHVIVATAKEHSDAMHANASPCIASVVKLKDLKTANGYGHHDGFFACSTQRALHWY